MPGSKQAPEGWFSRRHRTRDAHDEAVQKYKNRRQDRPIQFHHKALGWEHVPDQQSTGRL